jgi:hypothetical protein
VSGEVPNGAEAWALTSRDGLTLIGWFRTRELAEQARLSLGCNDYDVRLGRRHPKTGEFIQTDTGILSADASDRREREDPLTELNRYLLGLQDRYLDDLEREYGPLIRGDDLAARDGFRDAGALYIRRYGALINAFLSRFAPMLPLHMRDELCREMIHLAAQGTTEDTPVRVVRPVRVTSTVIAQEQRLKDMLSEVTRQLSNLERSRRPWWKRVLPRSWHLDVH